MFFVEARVFVSFGYGCVCGTVDIYLIRWAVAGNFSGFEGVWGTLFFFQSLSRSKLSVRWLDSRGANLDVHRESKRKSPVTQSKDRLHARACYGSVLVPFWRFSKEDLDRSQTGFFLQLGDLTKDELVGSRDFVTVPAFPLISARKWLEDRP